VLVPMRQVVPSFYHLEVLIFVNSKNIGEAGWVHKGLEGDVSSNSGSSI